MVLTGKVKSITSLSQDPNNSLRMFVLEEKPNIDFYVNSGAVSDPAVPINLFGPPLRRNAKVVGAHIKETRSGDIVELCALESPRRINEDQRTFFVTGYINKSYYERLSPRLHLEL